MLIGGHETTVGQLVSHVPALPQDRTRHERLWSRVGPAGAPPRTSRSAASPSLPARPSLAPRRRRRDEGVFKNTETVLLDRETNPHIAFGQCPHQCPVDPPARVELQTVLEALTSRLPGLRLAVPADELTWHRETLVRSLVTLPVTW